MKFLFFVVALFFIEITFSQSNQIRNLTVNDGLSGSTIRSIFKDSKGIIWVGTESGIVSYDGINFKYYNHFPGYKYAEVWSICEDLQKNIWISFYGEGIAKFDGKCFQYFNDENGLASRFVRKVYYSTKYNCIVAATEKGVSHSINGQDHFITINNIHKLNSQFMDILEMDGETYLLSRHYGIFRFEINRGKELGNLINIDKKTNIFSFDQYKDHFLMGSSAKKLKISGSNKEIKIPSIPWDITDDNSGNKYIATWDVHSPKGKIYRINPNKDSVAHSLSSVPDIGYLCLYFDKIENKLWAGSIDKGIFIIDLNKEVVKYDDTFFKEKLVEFEEVFVDNNNRVWLGSKSSISIIKDDKLIKKINAFDLYNLAYDYLKQNGDDSYEKYKQEKLKSDEVLNCYNFHSDKYNNIFINTSLGLFKFNSKLELMFYFPSKGGNSFIDNTNNFYYQPNYSPIVRIDNINEWYNRHKYQLSNENNPTDLTKILNLNSVVWIGTHYSGLFLLKNKKFYSFLKNDEFDERGIIDLSTYNDSSIIVTTKSGNIYQVELIDNHFVFKKKESILKELQGDMIQFSQSYKNYLFVGTKKAIKVFKDGNLLKLIPFNFDRNIILKVAKINLETKQLFIGSNRGVFKLDIKKVLKQDKNFNSTVLLSKFLVNGNHYNNRFKKIKLNHDENDVELFFRGSNLTDASFNFYRYKVDGLSDKWSKFKKERSISLIGLKPGKYNILIEGKNNATGKRLLPLELSFVISPPFWKTWWFLSIISIGAVVFLIIFVRNRVIKNQKIKNQQLILKDQLNQAKLEALRAQINPHFTFNAINSIQNYIIDEDTDNALHYLGVFSKLIRQTLENSFEKFVPLNLELDFLHNYISVQQIRFDTVKVFWNVSENINVFKIGIPPLIIQPYIENVFEHAFDNSIEDQNVEVNFKIQSNQLICEVVDNGIGIQKGKNSSLHRSRGLEITKSRFDLMNEDLKSNEFQIDFFDLKEVSDRKGTLIRIFFPLYNLDSSSTSE